MSGPGIAAEDYDAAHAAVHRSALMRRLWAEAMGDQYPEEVEPFSSCTWWVLGQTVTVLRLRPGGRLVDLGCGRGGPGLWLARALSASLIGIDFSPVAVKLATERAERFVGPDRAEFRRATFDDTGLPDASVDGAVSMDALPFGPDRMATLREVRRILVPGGRLAFTAPVRLDDGAEFPALAETAGVPIEVALPHQEHDEVFRRLHTSWLAHEAQLRAELGDRATDNLLVEARGALERAVPLPPSHLVVLRRPNP